MRGGCQSRSIRALELSENSDMPMTTESSGEGKATWEFLCSAQI